MKRGALLAAGILWLGFWFWAFSFAYGPGFFEFHRHTRIPHLVASLVCVAVVPASALAAWGRVREGRSSALGALVIHGLTSVGALVPPLFLPILFAKASGPWRLEADDAMGMGIDNAILIGIALVSLVVLVIALAARSVRGSAGE